MLPKYFYDLNEPVTLEGFEGHRTRWIDAFANDQGEERKVLTDKEWSAKDERDRAYNAWIKKFRQYSLKPKALQWQMVRVLSDDHGRKSQYDWWRNYKDALFRVYVNPHVEYSKGIYDHVSWYILCPEDLYLTHCYERKLKGISYPPRRTFKHISPHPELRKLRMIPVECCKHMRHETTAGVLPQGL